MGQVPAGGGDIGANTGRHKRKWRDAGALTAVRAGMKVPGKSAP